MTSLERLAAESPWNWCDRRCERCPLSIDCKLNASHPEHRREPVDLFDILVNVDECLYEAIEMLQAESDDQDIDEAGPWTLPPTSEAAEILCDAGMGVVLAAKPLSERPDALPLMSEVMGVAMMINGKASFLRGLAPSADDDEATRQLGALILLLLETLMYEITDLAQTVHRFGSKPSGPDDDWLQFFSALVLLEDAIGDRAAEITTKEREAIAALVSSGQAPSPFCKMASIYDARPCA